MSRVKIVLLCEDRTTDQFIRRFLRHRNFNPRDITTLPFPHGSGSGEAWVREQFPKELKAIRTQQNAYLIVALDADNGSVQRRRQQLNKVCREKKVPIRTSSDPVICAIPNRNIETWMAYLDGQAVDETTDYKGWPKDADKQAKAAADQLHTMCHEQQKLRNPAPPSLKAACKEYQILKR